MRQQIGGTQPSPGAMKALPGPGGDDEELKNELGDKFEELDGMMNQVKQNLKRVNEDIKRSQPLPSRIQHPYTYSKYDTIHEPYNVVENILKDDDSVYKALTPSLDITLSAGQYCFVADVLLYPGDCGPSAVEVSLQL